MTQHAYNRNQNHNQSRKPPSAYSREFGDLPRPSTGSVGDTLFRWLLVAGFGFPIVLFVGALFWQAIDSHPAAQVASVYRDETDSHTTFVSESKFAEDFELVGLLFLRSALDSYYEEHGNYPPAETVDEDGKPLHSWRTLLLPHFSRRDLRLIADSINWDQPWNALENHLAFQSLKQSPPLESHDIFYGMARLHGDAIERVDILFAKRGLQEVHWMEPVSKHPHLSVALAVNEADYVIAIHEDHTEIIRYSDLLSRVSGENPADYDSDDSLDTME